MPITFDDIGKGNESKNQIVGVIVLLIIVALTFVVVKRFR